jgi:outer membrane lipoprotein-sorting protein
VAAVVRKCVAWGVCGAVLAAGLARADVESMPVLKKGRQTAAKARTLQADMQVRVGERVVNVTVLAQKPNLAKLVFTGTDGAAVQKLVSTGRELYVVLDAQKLYSKRPAPPDGEGIAGIPGSPLAVFFQPDRLGRGGKTDFHGTERREGVDYEVVRFNANEPPRRRELFFGPSGLLEGVELEDEKSPAAGLVTVWLRNLKLDAPIDPLQFAYTPPANYAEIAGR